MTASDLPRPHDESRRLAALRLLGVLDTPPEERFDRLARLASAAIGTPIALVSLVDEDRQWFKARVGLDATETPREYAFCAHAIADDNPGPFVVPDATLDARFADNPLVTGAPHIRFYAGEVVRNPHGQPMGTLCTIDQVPRELSDEQAHILRDLADLVEHELAKTEREDAIVELERSERSKATLIDALSDGLVVQDADGRIVEWNGAASRLLGLSDDELSGRTSFDPRWRAVHPDGQPWPGDEHPAIETLRTGQPISARAMGVHRPDGSLVWLEVTSRPILDRGGRVISVLTLFCDIATRFDADRASETMALRLRQAIESSGIGTAILDADGSTIFVNAAYASIVGRSPDQLLGRPHTVWIHPDDTAAYAPEFAALSPGERVSTTIDIRVAQPDASQRWVRSHLSMLDDDTDGVEGTDRYLIQLEDVTTQRRLEAALRHSEELARTSVEALEEGVILADATGMIHQMNPAAEQILGFTAPELTERFRSGTWTTYDEFGEVLPPPLRPIMRALSGETVYGETVGWRHRDGHLVILRTSSIPIAPCDQGVPRIVVGIADVTDQRLAERLLDLTLATAPAGIAVVDDDRRIIRCNPTFAAHLGLDADELPGSALDELVSPPIQSTEPGHDLPPAATERLIEHDDGTMIWVETRHARITGLDRPLGIVATFDVSEHKRLESRLERFGHLFRHANDIITVVDPAGVVLYSSPSSFHVLGYPEGYEPDGGVLSLVHPDDIARALHAYSDLATGGSGRQPFTSRIRAHDGSWKYIETVGTNLLDEPSVHGIVLTSRDVTERQLLGEKLAHQATHDSLTDLPNRALAEDRLGAALARALREDGRAGVCYLDLDGFKQVNDQLGHAAGDALLIEVGARLRSAVRGSDLAARVGGDEFVVVLDVVSGTDDAINIAQRLHRQLMNPPLCAGDLLVGVSIGVAVSDIDDTPSTLLSRADAALYRAKALGGSHVEFLEAGFVPHR
jgi:diguanylate cyclase (GGDEF)-like protein/PAS domain S-box-containing protein